MAVVNYTVTVTVDTRDDYDIAKLTGFADQFKQKLIGAEYQTVVVTVEATV